MTIVNETPTCTHEHAPAMDNRPSYLESIHATNDMTATSSISRPDPVHIAPLQLMRNEPLPSALPPSYAEAIADSPPPFPRSYQRNNDESRQIVIVVSDITTSNVEHSNGQAQQTKRSFGFMTLLKVLLFIIIVACIAVKFCLTTKGSNS